jgi:hypothetical protein
MLITRISNQICQNSLSAPFVSLRHSVWRQCNGDEWDHQFNDMHEKVRSQKNPEAAGCLVLLVVNVNATASGIKQVFRKQALKCHLDDLHARQFQCQW